MANNSNKIRVSAEGLALQVTKPARASGLVVEGADGDAKDAEKADVYVYGFDDVLVVIDRGQVSASSRAELVATAAEATDSIHHGTTASVTVSGDPGYKVQLPGCREAGFRDGDVPQVTTASGILVIHDAAVSDTVAKELVEVREEQ